MSAGSDPSLVQVESAGLGTLESVLWFGGTLFYASAAGGPWSIRVSL